MRRSDWPEEVLLTRSLSCHFHSVVGTKVFIQKFKILALSVDISSAWVLVVACRRVSRETEVLYSEYLHIAT